MGKPIIASAGGETKNLLRISKSGFCSNPENDFLLYKNILKLINLKKKRLQKLGHNSKIFFNKNFEKKIINDLFKKLFIT